MKVPGKHEILAEAEALTAQWLHTVSGASALVERINDSSVADWRWASNEFKGRVESALVALNAAQTTFIDDGEGLHPGAPYERAQGVSGHQTACQRLGKCNSALAFNAQNIEAKGSAKVCGSLGVRPRQ